MMLQHFKLHFIMALRTASRNYRGYAHTRARARGDTDMAVASLISSVRARAYFLSSSLPLNDTSIINGNQRGNLYYSKPRAF